MPVQFHAPPGWPTPATGWAPPPGWLPDPAWPPAPDGWQFWTTVPAAPGVVAETSLPLPATPDQPASPSYGSTAPLQPPTVWPPQHGGAGDRPTGAPVSAFVAGRAHQAGNPDRRRLLAIAGWGGLAVTALAGLISGIGGALLFAGMFAFVVALVALIRGQVRWAHLPSRAAGAVALVGALVAVSVGGALSPSPASAPTSQTVLPAAPAPASSPPTDSATTEPAAASPTSTTATASPSPTDPVTAAIGQARPGTALAALGTLTVKGRGPMTGYTREAFGAAWSDTDRNGCDQRNDTLRRDLRSLTLKAGTNGCAVMTGTLVDPYTGARVVFTRGGSSSSAVHIDHVVALADAWVKGAGGWPQAKRASFANDTLNLMAVSASVNASKGSGDAATWLPPATAYRCTYVARQIAVKVRYELAVTAAERAAMARILTGCPATRLPTVSVAKLGGWPIYAPPTPKPTVAPAPHPTVTPAARPAPRPAPQPSPSPSPAAPAPRQGVHPGAFCSPAGALGYTSAGTLMRCSYKAGDIRARWRSA